MVGSSFLELACLRRVCDAPMQKTRDWNKLGSSILELFFAERMRAAPPIIALKSWPSWREQEELKRATGGERRRLSSKSKT